MAVHHTLHNALTVDASPETNEARAELAQLIGSSSRTIAKALADNNTKLIITACSDCIKNITGLLVGTLQVGKPASSVATSPLRQITTLDANNIIVRKAFLDEDLAVIAHTILVELSEALDNLFKANSVALVLSLTSIALRLDQIKDAERIHRSLPDEKEKQAAYGVPARVVRCIPANISEIIELCENSDISNIRMSSDSSRIIASVNGQHGMTDVHFNRDDYIVSVLDEVRIVDEATLNAEYTM